MSHLVKMAAVAAVAAAAAGVHGFPFSRSGSGSKIRSVGWSNPASAEKKPARNAPCPCGSGVKFKKCCFNKAG